MRLSFQGCLILCVLFLGFSSHANATLVIWWTGPYPSNCTYQNDRSWDCVLGSYGYNYHYRYHCPDPEYVLVQSGTRDSYGYTYPDYSCALPEYCETYLTHEPGGDIDPQLCGACSIGYVRDFYDATHFDCILPRDPAECYEQGLAYDSEKAQCTEVCEQGMLNGVCMNPTPENEESCNSESSDFQGYIGNGNTRINICESDRQCDGGSFGVVSGFPVCIPDEYGPEQLCSAGSISVMDEYGFVCEPIKGQPEQPEPEPEEPNTDTTGDGQPDTYTPDNDPNIDRKL